MLNYELLTPSIERAAALAAGKFPGHHDINDVKQGLWVWALENKGTVSDLMEKSEGSDRLLVNLMVKAALTHLKKEDAQTYGYDEGDAYNYSIDLIKSVLEVIFRHEDWQSFASALDAMPRVKQDPSIGGNNLASYADVKSAVEKLPEDQYNTIVWRYKYSYTFQQVGAESGVSKQAAENRHRAALSAIQGLLGKRDLSDFRRGYSGRTEARGNISGQIRAERDYSG